MNIKAVARLTGLTEHTIRAWEKRYSAIAPGRSDSGRRTYSVTETARLKLLAALVRRDHSIGSIASLPADELQRLLDASTPVLRTVAPPEPPRVEPMTRSIIEALHRFDLDALAVQISKAALRFDIRTFIYGVALPLMQEVGMQVDSGKLLIAQEHALSVMLRDQLGQMLKILNTDNHSGPRIAVATPAGDMHEFGIMLSAILIASHGWSVQYLGPNLPADELARACRGFQCAVALLGTTPIPPEELKMPWAEYLRELDRQLPDATELWIGGAAAAEGPLSRLILRPKTRWIARLETLEGLIAPSQTSASKREKEKDRK